VEGRGHQAAAHGVAGYHRTLLRQPGGSGDGLQTVRRSAADLRREQEALRVQLTRLQARAATSKRLVEKVETARREGDQFLAKYVTDRRNMSSTSRTSSIGQPRKPDQGASGHARSGADRGQRYPGDDEHLGGV